ncbi:MAG: hypothetical protein KF778_13845 [Rhodocyclaceae bacterium]|nr:hypothetical protein [Rhodocyclaceae bacterium]MBX3669476.1 hypothetical protein [Rhodocyclaceae bacterium]
MQAFSIKPANPRNRRDGWLQLAGKLGFLFFLVKGLCWLALPPLFIWLGWNF